MFIYVKTSYQGQENTIKLNIQQIAYIDGNMLQMANGFTVFPDEESLKEIHRLTEPKDKQTKSDTVDKKLEELFVKLHTLTKGKGKPVFSLQREKKLKDLLTKHRMTEEQLIKAATSVGNDKFLQGENDGNGGKGKRYGDVDYLLRPDKAAKYADLDIKEDKKKMF